MPFSPEHKQRTHDRIVKTASRLFRKDGYAATGVDRLMEAAGLTRGGFYAHFRDKAALLSEAIDGAFVEARRALLEGRLAELSGSEWLAAATEKYLSSRHRRNAASGCAIPTLGAEVARAPARTRKTFGANVASLIDAISQRLGGDESARRRAIFLLSAWTGGLLLSRSVADEALADEILTAVKRELVERDAR